MRFTIAGLLLFSAMLWSAMAVFGLWGIAVAVYLVVLGWLGRVAVHDRNTVARNGCAALVLLGFLVAVTLPALQRPRIGGRRDACVHRLRILGAALHAYSEVYGTYPPAFVRGPDGKPWHSWRVLLLPYLEQKVLYEQYDFSEPWNGPNNIGLTSQTPYDYWCPSDRQGASGSTSYSAVIGPQTVWTGGEAVCEADVRDEDQSTILLVETVGRRFAWTEPHDITWDETTTSSPAVGGQAVGSRHSGGTCVLMADGSVWLLPNSLSYAELRALLTIDGRETVDLDRMELLADSHPAKTRSAWTVPIGLLVLLTCAAILVFWPPRRREKSPERAQAESG
jgi:prepilin-type processing-associated H-X9-DG protein